MATAKKDENVVRGFQNFGNIVLDDIHNMNVLDALNNKYVIIADTEESLKALESRIK